MLFLNSIIFTTTLCVSHENFSIENLELQILCRTGGSFLLFTLTFTTIQKTEEKALTTRKKEAAVLAYQLAPGCGCTVRYTRVSVYSVVKELPSYKHMETRLLM